MDLEINADCCRLCLTKSKKLRPIYKPIDDGEEPPNEMLRKVMGIEVEEMEKFTMLPKNICKNCVLSLSMAYEFRQKVLQSQQAIVAFMQRLQIPYPEEEKASAALTIHGKCIKQEEDDIMQAQQFDESGALEENLHLLDSNSNSQLHLDASQITENDHGHDAYVVDEVTERIYVKDEVEDHNTEQQHQKCEDDYQQQFLSHNNVITGELAEIKVLLRQLIVDKKDAEAIDGIFPIKDSEDLKRLEEKISVGEEEAYVKATKRIIRNGGLLKNFRNLLGENIIKKYNYDGLQNMECFKSFHKINRIIFQACESEVTHFDDYTKIIKKGFKISKNREYKKKCLQAKSKENLRLE